MIGAGTIINPILKIVTTVAILGAVYLFIVRPVLDTTENISAGVGEQTRKALEDADAASEKFDLNFARDRADLFASSLRSTWPEAAREVTNCVGAAGSDASAMKRCDEFGHQLITEAQSNRNFALSYANDLSAQGKTAESDQVDRCVSDAEFKIRAIAKCRNLADRLLFP